MATTIVTNVDEPRTLLGRKALGPRWRWRRFASHWWSDEPRSASLQTEDHLWGSTGVDLEWNCDDSDPVVPHSLSSGKVSIDDNDCDGVVRRPTLLRNTSAKSDFGHDGLKQGL